MVKTIVPGEEEEHLEEAAKKYRAAGKVAALTGAGISVESGIPDFRSPGGVWTVFRPDEYATLDVFLNNPEKAWELYRTLGETVEGAKPNPAHIALAELEQAKRLAGVVTQNVDGLHQAAGSENVIEIHGDHQHLQCLECGRLEEVKKEHYVSGQMPRCALCYYPLKPNVVLFGENVRGMDRIHELLWDCDLLLVIGTSVQVYPSAGLPNLVKQKGGLIFEFNMEPTGLTRGEGDGMLSFMMAGGEAAAGTDYFFHGKASRTLSLLAERVI